MPVAQQAAVDVHGGGGGQQVRPQLTVQVRVVEAREAGQGERREQDRGTAPDRRRRRRLLGLVDQLVVPHQHAHGHLPRRLRAQLLLQLLPLRLVAAVLEPDLYLETEKASFRFWAFVRAATTDCTKIINEILSLVDTANAIPITYVYG